MNYTLPQFATKDEIFKYLVANKSLIFKQKKAAIKKCDAFSYFIPNVTAKEFATKDVGVSSDTSTGLLIKIVGNTTNLMDGHDDVHIPGIWKKTLSENEFFLHLQEHEMEFQAIICDEMKCYTKTMSWSSLNQPFTGNTQALIGESTAELDRNTYMCDQYKKGYVKNHSVGMQYVQIIMCINSEQDSYKEYKANWDKYYPQVANQDRADSHGYFFAVTEAKLIEISAVVRGSNYATPTQSVEDISEAGTATSGNKNEPPKGTHGKKPNFSNVKFL